MLRKTFMFGVLIVQGMILADCAPDSVGRISDEEAQVRQSRRLAQIEEMPVPADVKARLKSDAEATPITPADPVAH